MRHALPRLSAAAILLSACGGGSGSGNHLVGMPGPGDDVDAATAPLPDNTPDDTPDAGAPAALDLGASPLGVGGSARVTASSLNLRTGAGTMNPIIAVMHCGDSVEIVGGPDGYWWNVQWQGPAGAKTGWASGNFLVSSADFDGAICALPDGGAGMGDGGISLDQMSILARARLGVGYSYYWGPRLVALRRGAAGSLHGQLPQLQPHRQLRRRLLGLRRQVLADPVSVADHDRSAPLLHQQLLQPEDALGTGAAHPR